MTYQIEVQTMTGEWSLCKATMQWNGTEWIYPVFNTEAEARAAAEAAWPDRFPEGSANATFRIVTQASAVQYAHDLALDDTFFCASFEEVARARRSLQRFHTPSDFASMVEDMWGYLTSDAMLFVDRHA